MYHPAWPRALPDTSSLNKAVADLDGVGPTRATHLKSLGIATLGDLLEYFPRTYQSESAELSIAELSDRNQIQTVRGQVVAVDYVSSRPRPRFEATIEDEHHHKLGLVWFNGSYLRTRIHPGKMIRVQGRVRMYHNLPQMANPKWEEVDESVERIATTSFRPIYPATARLPSETIARSSPIISIAPLRTSKNGLLRNCIRSNQLISRQEAYRWIHQPGRYAAGHAGAAANCL